MPTTPPALTAQEQNQLDEDGFVALRGVLPPAALDPVREALAEVVDRTAREWYDAGLIRELHDDQPFELRWARLREQLPARRPVTWRRVLACRAMYDLWRRPELTERLCALLGPELWAHDTWNGRPREPGTSVQRIGWHQDAHYLRGWSPADDHVYTCWIPLVPADQLAGCLQLLRGSHRNGVLPRVLDEYRLKNIPDEHLAGWDSVTLPAEPGDLVLFTESTVHRALDNVSGYVRWTVDIRFARDSPAVRSKARGGFLCRTAGDGPVDDWQTWVAKYDPRDGAMASQLRAIDIAADRAGAAGRDMRTY